jgi:ubiquinone biosynthesis protein
MPDGNSPNPPPTGAPGKRVIFVDRSRRSRATPAAAEPAPAEAPTEHAAAGVPATPVSGQPGVMASLPRRSFLTLRPTETPPPSMRVVTFTASRTRAFGRLLVWLTLLVRVAGATGWDFVRGRNSRPRRAVHLRRAFERAGGTFVKVGQHLAMRLDLIPWEYGAELSRMVDRVAPFPSEQAVAAVEAVAGRPLAEVFERFDPEPVASLSIACIYQAVLRSGERVVVKVRRPGIGELVAADLTVFGWIARVLEALTVLRPGQTQPMRQELRDTLFGHLDFVQEARYQDLFRRAARTSGKRFFTAPRVHFDISAEDVIVEEFVAGMWLWELLAAGEDGNQEVLALAARLNIDPALVARRLTWVNYWSWHEHLFFRADPLPDKIIVGPGGRLTFTDFASVGTIEGAKRRALQQSMYFAWKRDPLNMARASLVLLEPLPPVDPSELSKELEAHNLQMLFAFEARGAQHEWFSRTSARQWIGLIQLARRHRVAIDFHILQFLRGSVLYDALAVRLDPEIDVIKEYRRFARYRASRARRRLRRRLVARAAGGRDQNQIYLTLERLAETGEKLFFRLRHALTIPRVNFNVLMGKGALAGYLLIRLAAQVLAAAAVCSVVVAAGRYVALGHLGDVRSVVDRATSSLPFWLIAASLVVINVRTLLYRIEDRDA